MLLPYWTDGCIGSMEGLYFEASATTPFHFLTQVELSTAPSAAQRDLPYGGLRHHQGRRPPADDGRALLHGDLTPTPSPPPAATPSSPRSPRPARGSSSRWPTASSWPRWPTSRRCVEGVDDSLIEWVEEPMDESGRFNGPAISWFNDPTQWDVPLARSGPDEWQRVAVGRARPRRCRSTEVEVSNIEAGDESISFDVDQVGRPGAGEDVVLPQLEGRRGAGPVPGGTQPHGRGADRHARRAAPTAAPASSTLSYVLTLLGLVGLVLLWRRPRVPLHARGAVRGRQAGSDSDPAPAPAPCDGRTVRRSRSAVAVRSDADARHRAERAAAPAGDPGAGADAGRHRPAGAVPPGARLDPRRRRPGGHRRRQRAVVRPPPGGDVPQRPLRALGGGAPGLRRRGGAWRPWST